MRFQRNPVRFSNYLLLMVVVLAGCVVVSDGAPVYGGYGYAAVPVVIAPGYGYSSAHRYGPHYRGGR